MSQGFNQVILLGNLTRNPELKYTPSGTAICNFGVAVNRKWKSGDDEKEETMYVDCVAFGKQAENLAQYLEKGKKVFVVGRLQYWSWENSEGEKRSKHEVVTESVVFL